MSAFTGSGAVRVCSKAMRPSRLAMAGRGLILLLGTLLSTQSFAQAYPLKPVRILVPYDPGGAVDLTARLLQQRLAGALGQQVVVENRPSGAGKVGAEMVSNAEPDGYLILYTAGGTLITWQANPASPESVRRLTPVTSAVTSVGAIAARKDLPVNSMAELLNYAKRNPGKLSYASTGIGSWQHLVGEWFTQQGWELLHVPYKGLAPAMTALASGQIDLVITNLATGLPFYKDGKVKMLAMTQPTRFDALPEIPAINEAVPTFDVPAPWYGFWGPPQLPRPIVARIAGDIAKSLVAPEVKTRLTELSMVATLTNPDQFSAMVRDNGAVLQKIIKAGNIKLD